MSLPHKVFLVLTFLYVLALPLQMLFYSKFKKVNDITALGKSITPLTLFGYWLVLHCAIFIIRDVWVLYFLVLMLGFFSRLSIDQRMFLYAYLFFAIPMYFTFIPGFAGIRNFLRVDYAMVLAVGFLGPAYLKLKYQEGHIRFGKLLADKCIFIIMLLIVFNSYRETMSFTIILKEIIIVFCGIYLPYMVISRRIRFGNNFNIFLLMIFLICFYQAIVNVFEFLTGWKQYNVTDHWIGAHGGMLRTRFREGFVRATAVFTQAIISGYFMMLALSIYLYFMNKLQISGALKILMLLILMVGLYSSSSRAPWVGAVLFVFLFFVLLSDNKIRNFVYFSVSGLFGVLMLAAFGQLDRFIGMLPWFKEEQLEVMYRVRLIEQSWKVIKENPILGEPQNIFLKRPEMIEMIQGEGIVDLVNSYLSILLYFGVVGLLAHLLITLVPAYVFFKGLEKSNNQSSEFGAKAKSIFLLSMIIVHMFVVSTVSSIGHLNHYTYILYAIITGMALGVFDKKNRLGKAGCS